MSRRDYLSEYITLQGELAGSIDLFGKKTCKAAQAIQRWGNSEKEDVKSLTSNVYEIFAKIEDAFCICYKHGIERSAGYFMKLPKKLIQLIEFQKEKKKLVKN